MSKKSQEILYDSEEENTQAVQQEQPQPQEMPQDQSIVAPKPQRAPKQTPVKEAVKQTFTCQLCNKQFARNYYLNRHIDEGRCNVKRNIELAKQKQLEETERLILEKMNKKAERLAKKEAKMSQPVKQPVKQAKNPPQQQQPAPPPPRPQAPPPRQQQTPYPNFIINF